MYCSEHLKGLSAHVTADVFVLVLDFVPCFIINCIMLTIFTVGFVYVDIIYIYIIVL